MKHSNICKRDATSNTFAFKCCVYAPHNICWAYIYNIIHCVCAIVVVEISAVSGKYFISYTNELKLMPIIYKNPPLKWHKWAAEWVFGYFGRSGFSESAQTRIKRAVFCTRIFFSSLHYYHALYPKLISLKSRQIRLSPTL